ncbi:MAG: hypothetical protein FJW86_07215 [Actinobacteria bacterium]|nr:hypothetical protein [Actinomycetota bacterium]
MGGRPEDRARRDRLSLAFAAAAGLIAACAAFGRTSAIGTLLGAPTLALLVTATLAVGIAR